MLDSRAALVLCYEGYFLQLFLRPRRRSFHNHRRGAREGSLQRMFAVVETGGKQYKVSPGQTLEVEKLPAEPGDTVELGRVLLISADDQTFIGAPVVENAKVVARVTRQKRGPKIIVFRYKSKSRYRRKTGHRQDYTELTIEDIWANGTSLLPASAEEATPEPAAQPEAEVQEAPAEATKPTKKASGRKAKTEEAPAEETTDLAELATTTTATTASSQEEDTAVATEVIETRTTTVATKVVTKTRVKVVTEVVEGEATTETEVVEGEATTEIESEATVEENKPGRRARKGE